MPLSHGQDPRALAGGRLTGRWRYERTVGRGIALSYDRILSGPPGARRPDGRFIGRWRYKHVAGHGITLCYDRSASRPPAAARPDPEPLSPPYTAAPRVRVLCTCGDLFTFEGDRGICPTCGRPAEWPTMGQVEREMRSDLEELLRQHEPDADS